jgi:hypothetical protein
MDEIIKYLFGLVGLTIGGALGYLIRTVIEHRLAIDRIKENIKLTELNKASSKFRSSVLYELIGFYPIDQHWDKKNYQHLYNSLPLINSISSEFRYYLSKKEEFDKTVGKYNTFCRETTHNSIVADNMYPAMRKESEMGKKEEFENIINQLLSFTEEK